jgi:hypothetical protein
MALPTADLCSDLVYTLTTTFASPFLLLGCTLFLLGPWGHFTVETIKRRERPRMLYRPLPLPPRLWFFDASRVPRSKPERHLRWLGEIDNVIKLFMAGKLRSSQSMVSMWWEA